MEAILVSMIMAICDGNDKQYRIQDESGTCHEYFVNCLINKESQVTSRDMDWCVENKNKYEVK